MQQNGATSQPTSVHSGAPFEVSSYSKGVGMVDTGQSTTTLDDAALRKTTYSEPVDDPYLRSLLDLMDLQNGWDGEGSVRLGRPAINAGLLVYAVIPSQFRPVCVYPTHDGGVLIEYRSRHWACSIEIAKNGDIELYGVEIAGNDEFGILEFKKIDDKLLTAIRHTFS